MSTNTQSEQIQDSYRQLGRVAKFYDGIVTYQGVFGKLLNRLVGGFDAYSNELWRTRALSCIPEGFSGKLLEIPVGTGILTMPTYAELPESDITCMDYTWEMMTHAQDRAQALGLTHVQFLQGDVGALPFPDASFDIVLSLNGFHAFPDKEAAFRETYRVLKPGGVFGGCFYIEGEMKRTDFTTRHVFVPKKSFTPPFENRYSLHQRLESMYRKFQMTVVNAEAVFRCRK